MAFGSPLGAPLQTHFSGTVEVDALGCDNQDNVYVGDAVADQIDEFSESGSLINVVSKTDGDDTEGLADNDEVGYPAALCASADGLLAVADDYNNQVWLFTAAGSGKGFGQLDAAGEARLAQLYPANNEPWVNGPEGVAFGPDDQIFVGDTNHNRIAVFDSGSGKFLYSWGTQGDGNSNLTYPAGVCVSAGKVYVADSGNDRIQVYDTKGNYLQTVGSTGSGPGQFLGLFAVVVDGQGRVWAADEALNKISVFNADGTLAAEYGTGGSTLFQDLASLTVSPNGTVMAGDGATNIVYTWSTGSVVALYDGKAPSPTPVPFADSVLAFGPVPAKAGQPLTLSLPSASTEIHYEIYTADLRKVAEATESGVSEAVFDRTSELASGVYIAMLRESQNGVTRQAVQKFVITR